jgi:chemotaxis protein MotB
MFRRKKGLTATVSGLKSNQSLITTGKDMTILTSKGADNVESLESMKEKITRMQDALTKKDSVTLALVTSLKRSVGINDPDIQINVEKELYSSQC